MSGLLGAMAVLLGAAAAWFAVTALASGWRAVRIGGPRLLFSGWDWVARLDRVPPEVRPHMMKALRRWATAMGCLVFAGVAGIAAGGLP